MLLHSDLFLLYLYTCIYIYTHLPTCIDSYTDISTQCLYIDSNICIYTYIYVYIRLQVQLHVYEYIYIYICTSTHTSYIDMYTSVYTYNIVHVYVQIYVLYTIAIYIHMCIRINNYRHAYTYLQNIGSPVHTCIYICILNACKYTYIQYIYIDTYTYRCQTCFSHLALLHDVPNGRPAAGHFSLPTTKIAQLAHNVSRCAFKHCAHLTTTYMQAHCF